MDQAPQKTAAEFSNLMPSVVSDQDQKTAAELSVACHQHMDQAPQKTAAEFSTASDAISIWIKRLKKPQRNYLLFLMPSAYGSSASKNRSGIICCF